METEYAEEKPRTEKRENPLQAFTLRWLLSEPAAEYMLETELKDLEGVV